MVRAAQKYNRVVQVGQWQRSDPHWDEAANFLKAGNIGRIRTVKVWAYQDGKPTLPVKPDCDAPVQSEPFSFHIPLVLGLCGRFDDGLGRTFTGLCP